MTYGYRPDNWPDFQGELERRGIVPDEIEKVELRPDADAPATITHVTVTLRSGRVETWQQHGGREALPLHVRDSAARVPGASAPRPPASR